MLGFVNQIFISTMRFFRCISSNLNSLKCISMNNQECKIRIEIVNINSLHFNLTVLKQINAVAVVTTSMIHVQKSVFLMLLKT